MMQRRYAIGGMVAAFILGLIFGGAAGHSGATGLSGTNVTNSATATSSAEPTPAPSPVALTGQGSKVIDPLILAAANYRVSWSATGPEDNFIVHIHGTADTGLINEVPPNPSSGEVLFQSGGGHFILEVKAGALSWTITFTPISS